MKNTLTQLTPIPVEFVVGHAQTKNTESQRKPYVELISLWAEHEGMEDEGLQAIRRIAGSQQTDANHMPKEFYQQYRQGEKAEKLIKIVQDINEKIILRDLDALDSRFELFQIDDGYETFVGDWLRKNGDYSIMTDRDMTYHTWTSLSHLNPQEASNRDLCHQIAQYFAPILSRNITTRI